MFLHERFCSICEATTAHINGECMTCSEKIERENFDQFISERRKLSIEERVELIEKWIYEFQLRNNIQDRKLG
jgi:hypothetical protein